MCKRVFFDLDGTLAEFRYVDSMEDLYEKDYFLNLKPHEAVVKAFKKLNENKDIEVYILSAYLAESLFAFNEKLEWIKKYISPDFVRTILIPCGDSKADAVKHYTGQEIDGDCYLIDDYNVNLYQWEQAAGKGRALKLINDCNDRRGTFKGPRIYQNDHCYESILAAIS